MTNVNVYGAIGAGCCPSLFTDRGRLEIKNSTKQTRRRYKNAINDF